MATHAPITGAQRRAPAIDRRKLLAGLAVLPVGGLTVASPVSAWHAAERAYLDIRAAERRLYAKHIDPAVPDSLPIGPERSAAVKAIPAWVWEEAERLSDIRADAEDVLMAIPSPSATAFARKFLVAQGDGRETDCWNDVLQAEARRLAGAH